MFGTYIALARRIAAGNRWLVVAFAVLIGLWALEFLAHGAIGVVRDLMTVQATITKAQQEALAAHAKSCSDRIDAGASLPGTEAFEQFRKDCADFMWDNPPPRPSQKADKNHALTDAPLPLPSVEEASTETGGKAFVFLLFGLSWGLPLVGLILAATLGGLARSIWWVVRGEGWLGKRKWGGSAQQTRAAQIYEAAASVGLVAWCISGVSALIFIGARVVARSYLLQLPPSAASITNKLLLATIISFICFWVCLEMARDAARRANRHTATSPTASNQAASD